MRLDLRGLQISFAGLLVVSGAHYLGQDASEAGCLRADSGSSGPAIECSPDPLNVAHMVEIKAALSIFGIDEAEVRYRGCQKVPFETRMKGKGYLISYQVPANNNGKQLVAPIMHELAHVFQAREAGSFLALLKAPSLRIELGADFLAGLMSANIETQIPLDILQEDVVLVGRYYEKEEGAHGTPEQRNNAFRLGHFHGYKTFKKSFPAALKEFNKNLYGSLLN
ncbi:hypothetical protein [Massilia sp. BJB1822]|uniref:hypothetical protein n=1 Tax=Massilia sp. BJB1822 TaxID=2744470 RepID=UPI001592BDB1|nr:hypothetical protein [Massilia sp. BJB1822]NVD97906.1 hypothetical protein [Massilia sp. BJB1822]